MILFFHGKEKAVARAMDEIKERVSKAGYSISAGYVMRKKNGDLEETIRESDSRMYADKANYYRANGHDRRGRRDDAPRT